MRKFKFFVIGILCMLFLIACEQFFKDIEADFEYWTSEVIPKDISIDKPSQELNGVYYIPSADNVTITIKLHNPRKFNLIMPTGSGDAGTVINFPKFTGGGQPAYNTDYTLSLTPDKQELKLTFKQSFLQAHEWSNGDISPEITFTADDGRKFGKKFSMNLKVNTAPALEYAEIGKTTVSGEDYYVLIFCVKDMDTPITAGSLHKDINGGKLIVTSGGVPSEIPLSLNAGKTDFATGGDLLAASTVNSLDAAHPLPGGSWLLRLKTDVKVGGPEKEYSVSIKDSQGLSSAVISAKTKKNKLSDVELFDGAIPIGATPSSEGAMYGNPKVFAGMSGKTLTAKAAPAGAAITGKVEKQNSDGSWTEISGGTVSGTTPVTITLPALAAGEIQVRYKITLKASLTGYDDSNSKDFFVSLVRQEVPVLKLVQNFNGTSYEKNISTAAEGEGYVTEDIIPFAGNYNSSTNALVIYNLHNKAEFEIAPRAGSGAAVKYKLNNGSEESPTATPARIQLTGTGPHTLEVWAVNGGYPGPHTTVHIKVVNAVSNYTQLKNVVKNAPAGNGIQINIGGNLTASSGDTEIEVSGGKNLKLIPRAGGIYTIDTGGNGRIFKVSGVGTVLNLEDINLIGGNAADGGAVYVETGGKLVLKGKTVITPSTGGDENTPGKNDVYLAIGTSIKVDSTLTGTTPANPIVARITPQNYSEGTQVLIGISIVVGSEYTKFSVTQRDDGFLWTIKNDGKLKAIPTTINGGSGAWERLKDAVQNLPEGSTITINGEIKATNDPGNSDVINIDKNLTIQGKIGAGSDILNANSSGSYYAPSPKHRIFMVQNGKKLTLKNLTLKDGEGAAGANGGAIYLLSGSSKAELEGCIIEACKADKGGAIGCNNGSTVKLTNTIIKNCTANTGGNTGTGGAIYAEGATVEITSCTLKGNKADKGGGAIYAQKYNTTASTVTIEGGTIGGTGLGEPNKTTGSSGLGGGIYIEANTTVTLQNDAQIIGNEAEYGGGVYLLGSSSILKIKGHAIVDTNNDVYLNYGSGQAKITVAGSLTPPSGIAARITVADSQYNPSTQVLTGSAELLNSEHTKFTVTPKGQDEWGIGSDGKLKNAKVIDGGTVNAWKKLKEAVQSAGNGDVITIKGTIKATNASDNSGEIEINNKNITIKRAKGATTAVLDANSTGGDKPSSTHRIFNIKGTSKVHLENLTIKNGNETKGSSIPASGGGGIRMESTAELWLIGVTITDCTSKGNGGGLRMAYIASGGGKLTMKNSKIINNTVKDDDSADTSSGGGICLANQAYTAVIEDCEISGNKVDVSSKASSQTKVEGCGLYTGNEINSKTYIKGKTIIQGNSYIRHASKNTSVEGIGMWMQGGEVTIGEDGKSDSESPIIQNHQVGNADSVKGTAIYMEGLSTKVYWKSGQITNNGGSANAIYNAGGTLSNSSGHTAS
ncbi:hypothetical protein [Treponema denticola]|uniref:Polymorphic outer membrane protein n=1 Tax=Treponema denticola SP33 TaxID=999437 RepID=M2BA89_TREDN|nr:hypothetical protein [Treponema denticola]EMB21917.1 polymorphic outer membrane protein [Treponema denticola SP33]EPF35962.1 polymorphic outer membrane protein [Treponema denticola SP32]